MNLPAVKAPWLFLLAAVLLNASGAFLIKKNLNALGEWRIFPVKEGIRYCLRMAMSVQVQLGVAMFFSSPIVGALALSRLDASLAYPIMVGMNLLLVSAFGVIVLGEKLDFNRGLGILLLIAGLFFLY